MNASQIVNLLLQANKLKQTTRAGWQQRGVVQAESVAAHSFGTAFIALTMAGTIAQPFDLAKLLAMAILHDLPEGVTTDIPGPAWQLFPPGIKSEVERSVMQAIFEDVSSKQPLLDFWEELVAGESPEARLVHDCDRLDMYVQAFVYETQTGNRQLAEFWEHDHTFSYEASRAAYDHLLSLRE